MEQQPLPNNAKLAKMFFDVMMRTSTNQATILAQKRLIEACSGSIAEAFAAQGNLANFKIPKFWAKYYPVLESILTEGVSKTGESQVKADVARQRRRQFSSLPGSPDAKVRAQETDESWDDGIRRLES